MPGSAFGIARKHWDLQQRALSDGQRIRVASLSAGREGVRAGMGIAEARASCAALEVRDWNAGLIAESILVVTTALLSASPQVTPVPGAPGMWWVGATGFDGLGGEAMLAQALLAIACRWHPHARVAIADSCVAARAATWAPAPRGRSARTAPRNASGDLPRSAPATEGIVCIPRGGCAPYLAPAPLGLVPMEPELREALQALGLRTVSALAGLDAGDVERRWGPGGLTAWRLAHGDDPRRPGLVRVETARNAGIELPGPADSTAPVLFVLRALLDRLVRDLVRDARAAASVAITLVLDAGRHWPLDEGQDAHQHSDQQFSGADVPAVPGLPDHRGMSAAGSPSSPSTWVPALTVPPLPSLLAVPHRTITREIRPARPLARLEPLYDQCRRLLDGWTIGAPILGVTVSIPATAPLAADQGDLLVPSWRDSAMQADAVFLRLRTVLDPNDEHGVVVHAVAGDTHRPEEAARWEPADAMALGAAPRPAASGGMGSDGGAGGNSGSDNAQGNRLPHPAEPHPAVLRMLDAPEAVDVEEADGVPDAVWWRGRRLSFTQVDGPERLTGDWWRADAFARDYWRVVVPQDGELLLYREAAGSHTGWYLQGWYD